MVDQSELDDDELDDEDGSEKVWRASKGVMLTLACFFLFLALIWGAIQLVGLISGQPEKPQVMPSVEERAWGEQVWGFDIDE